MTSKLFLLILFSVTLSALAQLALKTGTAAARVPNSPGVGNEAFALAQNPLIWSGLFLYGLGAVLWLFVLGRVPLSVAYPFVGMGFILTMAAGALVLGEEMSAARIGGTLLIAAGCVLVARSA
ncbi:MAG: EamA family transporter [Parasphingorhabdus sp.]